MSTRPRMVLALAGALAIGCALGSAIAWIALRPEHGAPAVAVTHDQIGARMTEILNGPDPLQRVADLTALLPTLDPTAVPALVEALEAAPMDGGDPELVLFGMWWARFDPQAAFAWSKTDRRAQFASVIAAIVRSWAHVDPERALAAALGLSFRGQREIACDAAISGWDESGRPGLVEAVAKLEDTNQQRVAESVARRRVATLGPAGAFRWVESLEATPKFKEMMAVRVASAAAASVEGGPLAAEWATPRVRSDHRLSGYPRRIATRWVVADPEAAMAWLATLPAGADRNDGVAEAFRAWAMRDHPAAFAWIEQTETQPWNEPALAVYTRAIASERPKDAIERTQRIRDPELRESTTIVVGQTWIKQDRTAAEAWLDQADVSERVRRVAKMVVSDDQVRERVRAARKAAEAQVRTGAEPTPDLEGGEGG